MNPNKNDDKCFQYTEAVALNYKKLKMADKKYKNLAIYK